jgi:hypothetical protein
MRNFFFESALDALLEAHQRDGHLVVLDGAVVIEVNPEMSALTPFVVDLFLQGPSRRILDELTTALREQIERTVQVTAQQNGHKGGYGFGIDG